MKNKDQTIALLPSGFVDLLPPEAGQEADAISDLISVFRGFGYHRVKPPLLEFEESLFATGPGAAQSDDMFRLMDPISHKMVGIRSDITAQITRIVASRLKDAPRPLRLTYANDALRTKGSQQRTERQFTQVGCELVGVEDKQADVEVCIAALAGLTRLDVGAVTLDLTLPRLVDQIFAHYEATAQQQEQTRAALIDRDVDRLAAMASPMADVLVQLVKASGPVEISLDALMGIRLPQAAAASIMELRDFYEALKSAIDAFEFGHVAVSIDVIDTIGFEYHHGLGFSLFSDKARGPLGRGGRYEIAFGQDSARESACGFTLYMDTVRAAMDAPKPQNMVLVSMDESWGVIRSLQEEGWIVVRASGHNDEAPDCTHEYKGGKVVERT